MAFCDLYLATDRDTGARRTDKNGNPWLNIRVKPMAGGGSGSGGSGAEPGSPERGLSEC